ncbi:unnamed protein product [Hyaloperonospora brassicae]|uniref:RxLR effector candidate protein n=1 Tax=Hyaloperonospora brassicae TaxID=162125 RepID=A0AAV0TNE7_HYABA|nr:unnamed protein product [Hyaloperonospora brassicae]
MRFLTYVLTVLVVFGLDTAISTIAGDEKASGAAGSTPSAIYRTNVTLPVASRTGMPHDDAAVETDYEGQHDGEERLEAAQAVEAVEAVGRVEAFSGLNQDINHLAAEFWSHHGADDAITSIASHISESETIAAQKIVDEAADKRVSDQFENMQNEGGNRDYESMAASLLRTDFNELEREAEVKGLVKAVLNHRKDPDMTTHADSIHRELVYRFEDSYESALHDVWLEAGMTPKELAEMIFIQAHPEVANGHGHRLG